MRKVFAAVLAIVFAIGAAMPVIAQDANKAADDAEAKVLKAVNLKAETQFVITNDYSKEYLFRVTIKSGDSTLVSEKTIKSGATVTIKVPFHTNYMIEAEYNWNFWPAWHSMPSLNLTIPDYSVVSLRAYTDDKSGERSYKIEQTKVEPLVSPEIQAAIAKARAAAMKGDTEAVNEAIAAAKVAKKEAKAVATGDKPAVPSLSKDNFDFSAAFTGTWFLGSSYELDALMTPTSSSVEEDITKNFGLSALVNMKFFKNYGATIGLEIDDKNFKGLTDFLGYLNIKALLLKFDYHTISGHATWNGRLKEMGFDDNGDFYNRPVPTPEFFEGGVDFETKINAFSLLYDVALAWGFSESIEEGNDGRFSAAIGLYYATIEEPYPYDDTYAKWGILYTKCMGITALVDILWPLGNWGIWTYGDIFWGIGADSKFADGIKPQVTMIGYSRLDAILGGSYRWRVGNLGRLELALGFHLKSDMTSFNLGPTARIGMKF